jgi:predicted Fe-Mo cluster-binding NifX family protein
MRASTAAVFLYARAIKLPLLPLLFHYFGSAYSVVLSLYLAGFALLSGIVMERVERAEKLPIEPVDPTWMENRAMRIAIAADAPNIDTEVAAHAARAPYFLIFDTDGRLHAAPANPVVGSGQGAGPAAVQFLSGQGVGLVVAGEFGPHFLEALAEHRIRHAQQTGPVAEVIARLVAR